jgi:hypothetical protein
MNKKGTSVPLQAPLSAAAAAPDPSELIDANAHNMFGELPLR